MSVNLKVVEGERLLVSGSITSSLRLPIAGLEDRFWVSLSDGTRLLATPDASGAYGFRLFDEGAGIVRIDGASAVVEWDAEWVTVAGFYQAAERPPETPRPLPLFDRLAA